MRPVYKRKYLTGGLLTVSKSYPMITMARAMVAGGSYNIEVVVESYMLMHRKEGEREGETPVLAF